MKTIETAWGTVTADEDGLFLDGSEVVELDAEDETPSGWCYLVMAISGGYLARWVDENGGKHEKKYAARHAAVTKARESWGR